MQEVKNNKRAILTKENQDELNDRRHKRNIALFYALAGLSGIIYILALIRL